MSVNENRLSDLSVLNPEDIDRVLAGNGRSWVCEVDNRIVAFAMADLANANVYALFVEPGYEGQGIGHRLHDTMMDWFFGAEVW
jgi:GNAT superfamily N-acetyltransferase